MAEYTFHPSTSQLGDTVQCQATARKAEHSEQMLRRHDGLVHAVIRREGSGRLTYEEALQAGRVGLWRATLSYDAGRGTAFSTYAWVAIRRHIWRAAVQAGGDAGCGLIASPRQAPDVEAYVDRVLVHEALSALLCQLPDRLQGVIVARYGLDGHPSRSLRQLGAQLGLSHERIRQLEQDALAWLRHPAHSLRLRQRLGKNTVTAYRQALARNAALRRARRRRPK
jgi:RNA polymerase primary sigma factor/RNA polymerase sigma factor